MGKPKSTDLVVQPPLAIPLNIDPEKDSYIIKGGAGVAVAHVKKPSGEVFSVHVRANGAFRQMTHFDPSQLTVDERRRLELDLYEKGHTQSDIADLVGASRKRVNQTIVYFKEEGLVSVDVDGRINIHNREGLARFCN